MSASHVNLRNIALQLGLLAPADKLPYGEGLVASGLGGPAGAPWPVAPGTALGVHGPPAICIPEMMEDDQPYIAMYDEVIVYARDPATNLPVPNAEIWLNSQLTITLDGKHVSTVSVALTEGVGFFGHDREVSTLNLAQTFNNMGGGRYKLPRPALWSNVGSAPANRSVTIMPPTPAIGAVYPAAPGAAVNIGTQLQFFVFLRGVFLPMDKVEGGKGMNTLEDIAKRFELSAQDIANAAKVPDRISGARLRG